MNELTFLVPGHEVKNRSGSSAQPSDLSQATVTQTVRLDHTRGAAGNLIAVTAEPGRDIVVLDVEKGPRLYLHPENARDLFRAQQLRPGQRGTDGNKVEVPMSLDWPDVGQKGSQARGLTNVVASGIELLKGGYIAPIADWASSEIVRRVDNQVERGLYALTSKPLPGQLKEFAKPVDRIEPSSEPVLVFVHGTFSSTYGTFSKLWDHPALVARLFNRYGANVYALEHWTLGAGPIENALELARALPAGTRLHLLTHSRGGLVAEVMARVCGNPDDEASAEQHFAGAAYKDQLPQLRELLGLVKDKRLKVERVVRVACPARGTLLASKRLDAYLSVLKWTLELARIPVAPAFVEFIGAVAQHRTDPEQIPGLAAQMPGSPLVNWLHAAETPVPGELRVVAGDVIADSIGSWIKTLVSDAYYWQDNDFVVQTSSMYGGVPRAPDSTFVLARAGDVSHFSYFAREKSASDIVDGLVNDPSGNFAIIGPESEAGKSATGKRGVEERPAVIILPGILGSNLSVNEQRVWLSAKVVGGLQKLRYDPDSDLVKPDGPIRHTYGELIGFLAETHDVIEFAYDWRAPLQQEAKRLAETVLKALAARRDQPVRILAHSMGGLLARVFKMTQPSTWDAMFARQGARLLMLGTPNGGSWAPMQVLSGDDDFCNTLTLFGAPFAQAEARQMMAGFPGFLQMQAGLLDSGLRLADRATWDEMAKRDKELLEARSIWHRLPDQLKVFTWGIPPQEVLDKAVILRRALDVQAEKGLATVSDSVVMVVGHAEFTPEGFEYGKNGLAYREALKGGDGRVTLPAALLPGVHAWQVDREHGDLPREKPAFDAYLDLLTTGSTKRLPSLGDSRGGTKQDPRAVPGVPMPRRLRQGRAIPPDMAASLSTSLEEEVVRARRKPAIEIRMINGNLKFVGHPIIVGHYSSSQLTGSERVLDELIGGAMSATLGMGCYPNSCGAHQIFANIGINPLNPLEQMPRPQSVVVVGLGLEGALTATDLTKTVTQGVIAWAQRLRENQKPAFQSFEIATTLIGSGGVNMSAESSARAVARGVMRANVRLRALGWPTVACLDFVEVYLDRATEALRALRLLAEAEPDQYDIQPDIQKGIGFKSRVMGLGYRGAHYDLISALHEENADGSSRIVYSLNSRRAREDVHASKQQANLVNLLLKNAAGNLGKFDPQVGNTLFKLLVPQEIEPFLATSEEMQIELNEGTAAIPWELLDSDPEDGKGDTGYPWAIRAKLLRCLRTVGLPLTVNDAPGDAHFLVIGEPDDLPPEYPSLPGAREEALAVAGLLTEHFGGASVMPLIGGQPGGDRVDAAAVVGALFARDWRVVHIAGHGALPTDPAQAANGGRSSGGVVLSDHAFLGADEIGALRVVPALVFVNCCHLGNMAAGAGTLPTDAMPAYAATVAEALIRKGVRCVLVAGWAVDDLAARVFAETFYMRLKQGERFIEAVADARIAARAKGGNTWAAYQCYGDPNWTLTSGAAERAVPDNGCEELNEIASTPALVLALESLITAYRYENRTAAATLCAIQKLEARYGKQWGNNGAVAEAFGMAHLDLNDYPGAVDWLRSAVKAEDASASMGTVEKLGNVLARLAWRQLREAEKAEDKSADTVQEIQAQLDAAINLLQQLVAISPTTERHALLGSAYKRQAMVQGRLGQRGWATALRTAIKHYTQAQKIAETTGQELFYPTANASIGQMVLDSAGATIALPFADGTAYRSSLIEKNQKDPDFFSTVAGIEVDIYNAFAANKLSEHCADILHKFRDLYMRARGTNFWGPVLDQLDFVDSLWRGKVDENERTARKTLRDFLEQCQV